IDLKTDYADFREKFLERQVEKAYVSLDEARKNKFKIEWNLESIHPPRKLDVQVIEDQDLSEIAEFIDWSPFFRSWELHGKYPEILDDEVVGREATELFQDAQQMLRQIITEKSLKAKGVIGIFKANAVNDDDIAVYDKNGSQISTFHTLRQQVKRSAGKEYYALADFIAPETSGIQDYVGCFAVTTGFGTEELVQKYKNSQDDYNAIMAKALSDRLAE